MRKNNSKDSNQSKQEGNKYDKIIQENLNTVYGAILKKIAGFPDFKLANLPDTKFQTTIQRKTDGLKKIVFDNTKDFFEDGISHLEFQSQDEEDMAERMLKYLGMAYRKYKVPIYQGVIYIGQGKSKMNNIIKFGGLEYTFPVYSITDYSYKMFLNSDNSEEVVFSILANPENHSGEEIVRLIIERIVELNEDKTQRDKFITQLEMLSKKRNLQKQTVKIVNMMNLNYDVTTDIRYLQGQKKGIAKGLEKGIEKGELIKTTSVAVTMLEAKMAIKDISIFLRIDEKEVKEIQKFLGHRAEVEGLLNSGKKKISIAKIAKQCEVSEIFVEAIKELLEDK